MVARYQTCYTNSTEGSIHESIWKNQQPFTVLLQDAKNLGALRVQKLLIFLLVMGGEVASKVTSCVHFRLSPSA